MHLSLLAVNAVPNLIGPFLRSRRERIRPEMVGLPVVGRRRVPGLRREEVALLAGISADYYLRLEQGRDTSPSALVLDALARALQLDEDETAYLRGLGESGKRPRRPRAAPERVSPGIPSLIASWSLTPAFVHGRYLDVLARNGLAAALFPCCRPGANLVELTFLDPSVPELFGDWEASTAAAVAWLRAVAGADVDEPRLIELVGSLSVRSERFRELWARHDVRPKQSHELRVEHPQVGALRLRLELLGVGGHGGSQSLIAYHAEPGSESAQKLELLAALAAPSPA